MRPLISYEVASALDWTLIGGSVDLGRASWGEEAQRNDDETARITVVSDADYSEPTEVLRDVAGDFFPVENTVKRAQIQISFESGEGERAHDNAEDVRLHLASHKIGRKLHALGISILRAPTPTRKTPYLFESEWVDACSFDLEIGFQTTIEDDTPVQPTEAVEYSGQLDNGLIQLGPTTVEKPTT